MEKDNKIMLIATLIVMGIVLGHNYGLFDINLKTSAIQYYNQPVIIPFTLTNFTNPEITAYFNNIQLFSNLTYQTNISFVNSTTNGTYYQLVNNQYNQTITYSEYILNETYNVELDNVTSAGLLNIKVSEGNLSQTQSVDIRQPYVRITDNIPSLVDAGKVWTISINTLTPQGNNIEADSVSIDIYDPANAMTTIILDKNGNQFTKQYTFTTGGTYQFKVHASKQGYTTNEVSRTTEVTNAGGVNPILYVWLAAVILWFILFGVKMLRRFMK